MGVNRNKRNGYNLLIPIQGEDPKVEQMIYLMRKIVFEVNLTK